MKKLINPFNYLSGEKTLAIGVAGLLVMALTAWYYGDVFRGVVSSGYGDLAFWQLVLQQLAGWGIFASLLYLAARLLSTSKIRAVDIYGNQLFARIPFLIILLGGAIPVIKSLTTEMETMTALEITAMDITPVLLFGFLALAVLIWFFVWSYQGFSVAANLRGGKAAAAYIVSYLLAEVAASWCTATIAGW